jgi:superfamily I DNA/RNA helicase/mRNA-degrading endonuclease RelE of RelBE toxin-antitoxin system
MDIKVAFSDEFFGALTKLAPNIQAKVTQLVLKFQNNPKATGLNFEKINAVKDKSLRSIRVDQAYRVVMAAPEKGNVYLFLWVDSHDKAYDWASRHQCKINPSTGSIQLYSTETETIKVEQKEIKSSVASAFSELKNRQILKLGIPEEQLDIVRGIGTEKDLDKLQGVLPNEAYESLFYYMAGESYEDILREKDIKEADTFDVNNFDEALERAQSMANFMVPSDEQELAEMLNAPMEKWRIFLHPSQRKLVEGNKNGPVRVLGGAGTGKTVVAIHRIRWLVKQLSNTGQKVLFTTFTRNLVVDIKKNIELLCKPEQMKNIEVVNLDRWVQVFLRQQSYDYEVVFDGARLNEYWDKAISEKPTDLDYPDSFFKEEWQRVIQPQGVKSLDDYKRASRIGRGTPLKRELRMKIWPVFEEYRLQLNKARLKETDDAYRDAAELIQKQSVKLPYSSIIIDEAQDMGSQAFRLLRAMVPEKENDIFVVGDAHQRIYGRNKVVLSRCGINIRGRSKKLKINYRTTDEIRRWAVRLLEDRLIDDLDGGEDNNSLYKSLVHGIDPQIEKFESSTDQAGFIKALLAKSEEPNSHTCVVARTNHEVLAIKEQLDNLGIETTVIKPNEPEKGDGNALKLATMHRVKGLEFDQLILASANDGLVPLDKALCGKADDVSAEQAETEERSLVYVAMTRARRRAFVLSYGELSLFFKKITSEQVKYDVSE